MMIDTAAVDIEMVTPDVIAGLDSEQLLALLPMLPDHLQAAAAEAIEAREEEKLSKLRDFVRKLEGKRDKCVVAKREVESRWAEDQRQRLGFRRVIAQDRTGRPVEQSRLPPGLNVTADRCAIWSARVTNMMVPGASGQPWTINPTPSPEMYGDVPPEDIKVAAERAANGMREEIKDQFAACHVPQQVRLAADDLISIGTGIICGPENYRKRKKKFRKLQAGNISVMDVQVETKTRPAWRRVDPRYFFPEMVDRIEKSRFCFEVLPLTSAELKELADTEGFEAFRAEFAKVLEKKPDLGEWKINVDKWNATAPFRDAIEGRYAVWRFVGYLSREESEMLGCECVEEIDRAEQMMEVWFCEGSVLKAAPYVLDGSDRLPYYVVPFFRLDDTMFGGSLPWRARDAQDSIHALWHALQHNVSVSAGTITGYKDGAVEPLSGDWAITGPSTFRITDPEVKDIREVFSSFQIPNNADQILTVLKFRLEIFDQEINLPLIAQGQPSEAVPTSSGLAMMMNAANVVQKDIAQACEDGWLVPMLESAYAWNMLHNEREDIKGDFDCVATLTSDNVFKDLRAQRLMMLHNLRATDQELQMRIKEDVLYNQLAQAMEVDATLFRTEQEVQAIKQQQAQSQPQDPAILKIQLEQQKIQSDAEFQRYDRDLDNQEHSTEMQVRQMEAETERMKAQLGWEAEMAKLAAQENLTIADIQAKLGIETERESTKRQKIGADARLAAEKMVQDQQRDQFEAAVERNRKPGPIL